VFTHYFNDLKLSSALTELIIPAVYEENRTSTFTFSRYSAQANPAHNYKIVDVLMATSAAPTFFPAYEINEKRFLDGGLQINNPALTAYTEVVHQYKHLNNNVFVLSLGTGGYLPDPLKSNSNRGKLFYGLNLKDVVLTGQEGNVDKQMKALLPNDQYQRWQVWFEKPIAMDDYSSSALQYLYETGQIFLEELYAADDNQMNRLLERFGIKNDFHFDSGDDLPYEKISLQASVDIAQMGNTNKNISNLIAASDSTVRLSSNPYSFFSEPKSPLDTKKLNDALSKTVSMWEQSALETAIDRSVKESKINLKKELICQAKLFGFECDDVAPDGNCFFHAVAHQLNKSNDNEFADLDTDKIKCKALQYIIDHISQYSIFFGEDRDTFINKILNREWADHVFIHATAKVFNLTIAIIEGNDSIPKIINKGNIQKTIYLGHELDRDGRGWHYQSLRRNIQLQPIKILDNYIQTELDDAFDNNGSNYMSGSKVS
jgi:patatin-like phospholipase/acyl hydrolase